MADRSSFQPRCAALLIRLPACLSHAAGGHRLRVAVSSSNYPRFSASPNNGALPQRCGAHVLGKLVREGGALHVAENIVYFGKTWALLPVCVVRAKSVRTPSRVVLPTVSLDQIPNNIKPFA